MERHLDGCPTCRAEAGSFAETWLLLGAIDSPAPDSARMRARLDVIVDAHEHGRASAWRVQRHLLLTAAAAALVAIGFVIGHHTAALGPGSAPAPEIAAMRTEMHDLREMVSLSLMQQQSASERLKGVSWSGELDRPSSAMVTALLDTLMHDPNVNVRLATIDALERFASQDEVRRGAIQAVDRQVSPLVQIALIDFMVKEHERESIGTLRRLSQDPQVDTAVRARAAWGLQQLG
jgi:hypothetical protein